MVRKSVCSLALLVAMTLAAREASAIPALQIYIEGATYDTATETWVLQTTSSPLSLKLWVIGDTQHYGSILDVKLAAAYAQTDIAPSSSLGITLTSTKATSPTYDGFTDTTTPIDAFLNGGEHTDGSTPKLGDGSSLPNHGEYGPGINWQEFKLGDFTAQDSYITDFNSSPILPGSSLGQINVYSVVITGLVEGGTVHFDAYDHIAGGKKGKYIFAPFSHDGEGGTTDDETGGKPLPEPASLGIWGLGLGLVALVRGRLRRKTA
jgi:hypothetical protein